MIILIVNKYHYLVGGDLILTKDKILLIAIIIIILSLSDIVVATEDTHDFKAKEIKGVLWDKELIIASGFGISQSNIIDSSYYQTMAREVALERAQQNLIEMISTIKVNSKQTVNDIGIDREDINKLSNNIKILKEKVLDENTYMINNGLNLYGEAGLLKIILDKAQFQEDNRAKSTVSIVTDLAYSSHTGIIIISDDNLIPALAPKIYSEDGQLLYSLAEVDSELAIKEGIVSYSRDFSQAKKQGLIGTNPLVLKAKALKGKYKSDLVLSNYSAKLLKKVSPKIIREAKVIVVF